MSNCKKCGATINDDDLFCKECGEVVNKELEYNKQQYQNLSYNKSEGNNVIRMALIPVIAILFWVIGWFLGKAILG